MIRPMTAERWRRTLRSVSRRSDAGRRRGAGVDRRVQRRLGRGCIAVTVIRAGSAGRGRRSETSTMRFTTQVADGDDEREALDDDVVAAADRLEQRLAHAGQVEDRLGQDRAGQERAELQPDDRDHRQQRVAHAVADDHRPLLEALGPGRPDVVEAEHLEQARAGHPGDDRERDRAERDGRQDEVLGRRRRASAHWSVTSVLNVYMPDTKSRTARGGPSRSLQAPDLGQRRRSSTPGDSAARWRAARTACP